MLERLFIVVVLSAAGAALYCLYRCVHLRRINWLAIQTQEQPALDPVLSGLRPGVPAVIYFTTPNCIPCQTQQQPALARLQARLGDRVQIVKIDAAEQPDIAERWGVMTAPTTFVLGKNGKPGAVNYGVADEFKLQRQLMSA